MLVALESRSVAATGPAVHNVEKLAMNALGLHRRREGEFQCFLYCRLLLDVSHVWSSMSLGELERGTRGGDRSAIFLTLDNFTG